MTDLTLQVYNGVVSCKVQKKKKKVCTINNVYNNPLNDSSRFWRLRLIWHYNSTTELLVARCKRKKKKMCTIDKASIMCTTIPWLMSQVDFGNHDWFLQVYNGVVSCKVQKKEKKECVPLINHKALIRVWGKWVITTDLRLQAYNGGVNCNVQEEQKN